MNHLTLAHAQMVIETALERAREIDVPVSVAILDAGRELVAFARMDGALPASLEISQAKAYAARSLNKATGDVAPDSQPGGPLYGLEVSHPRPFVTFGGGDVLRLGDEIVGAVGIAGGTIAEDEDILDAVHAARSDLAGA